MEKKKKKKHWVISDADVRAGYITPLLEREEEKKKNKKKKKKKK